MPDVTRWLPVVLVLLLLPGCRKSEPANPDRPDPRSVVLGGEPAAWTAVSYPAPPLRATRLSGDVLDLDSLAGSVVLVNFWASWCGPCLREIPDLIAVRSGFAGRPFEVVGAVLNDPDSSTVREYAAAQAIPYPVVWDDEGAWAEALGGVFVMPSSFLLDRDRQVVRRITGLVDPDTLRQVVDDLLSAPR